MEDIKQAVDRREWKERHILAEELFELFKREAFKANEL